MKVITTVADTNENAIKKLIEELQRLLNLPGVHTDFGVNPKKNYSADYLSLQADNPADERVRIICAVHGVPDMYVEVLKLYCKDMTYAAIGKHLNLGKDTVKEYLKQSRKYFANIPQEKMKELLKGSKK